MLLSDVNARYSSERFGVRGFAVSVMFLVLLVGGAGFSAAAQDNDHWQGIYTFEEEELQARTSSWFRLEVKEVDGKLIGMYSEGVNGQATRRFQLSVKTMAIKAQFYFDHWLPRVQGINEPVMESEFSSGDLMFELEEQPRHCKTELITVWHKINLAARTETGIGEQVFFKRAFE
jgi:hypothetical protein